MRLGRWFEMKPVKTIAWRKRQAAQSVDRALAGIAAIFTAANLSPRYGKEPAMSKSITCKREGDEVVVRVPVDLDRRVVVAVEGLAGVFPAGWIVQSGVTGGIPAGGLYRLSEISERQARQCEGTCQSQSCARAHETPMPPLSDQKEPHPLVQGRERLAATPLPCKSMSAS